MRGDGRSRLDYRPYKLEVSPLTLTNGSSRIYLPNRSTDVLCSIKADIVPPLDAGILEINVEVLGGLLHNVSGRGRRRKRLAETDLSQILTSLISNALPLEQWIIVPNQYCWKLNVDILILSCSGNVVDVCSMAIYSALQTTYLPSVAILQSVDSSTDIMAKAIRKSTDAQLEIDGDLSKATLPPGADQCPIVVTLCRMGKSHWMVDATNDEEACVASKVSVSVDCSGNICGVQKSGEGGLPFKSMKTLTESAGALGKTLLKQLLIPAIETAQSEETKELLSGPFQFH